MIRISLLALLACSASAFTASLSPFTIRNVVVSPSARHVIMTDEETDAILSAAHECAEGECSIDDVKSLVHDLKDQEKILGDRLVKIMNMIAHLQHVNEKEERKTDEVRQLVKDMLRVFAHEPDRFPSSGWSGDVGSGPTDAYKALPPKPWKPAKKE